MRIALTKVNSGHCDIVQDTTMKKIELVLYSAT